MAHNQIREWVLRTVGSEGSHVNDIVHHFGVNYPESDPSILQDLFEAQEELLVDDHGRVTLSNAGLQELEKLGDHEWSRRAKGAG